MAKTLSRKTNFRVVVYPCGLADFGFMRTSDDFLYGRGPDAAARIEKEYQGRCEEMAADIRRHVDSVGGVEIEFDQEPVCEHCGSGWTEDSDTYNGGCCSKDEEGNPAEAGEATC